MLWTHQIPPLHGFGSSSANNMCLVVLSGTDTGVLKGGQIKKFGRLATHTENIPACMSYSSILPRS